ncbi:5-hydroxytryptamine receptor 3A-like [Gigantopelta aegis]|uniref:5-hydroxytryptamine receptor 3A-like n=1 Tax=Gigantopelta aegis TaxID=1735272 RepID=UPI001B889E8D|nr:5-hydroxytryptamine receptor 3A-like [Gigantopelta aegis]
MLDELDLLPQDGLAVNPLLYVPQGEWSYVSHSVLLNNISDSVNTHRTLKFKLKFERRWLFYSQYLLLPIMLNSVLMISVFLVPLDSGEKLGFSLTVLLSYVVLLTIVTDNLPPISTKTSVLQIYLSILMILGTVTTLLSIWVLTLYSKDETQRISFCLQKFTDYVIEPITCTSCQSKIRPSVGNRTPNDLKPQDNVIRNDDKENMKFEYERPQVIPPLKEDAWSPQRDKTRSCKEFATILDIFLFRVSLFGLFVLTLTTISFFVIKT